MRFVDSWFAIGNCHCVRMGVTGHVAAQGQQPDVGRLTLSPQPVDATQASNRSAGDW